MLQAGASAADVLPQKGKIRLQKKKIDKGKVNEEN